MAVQTKEVLKSYFETGDKPTQEEFADLIETLQTKAEVEEEIDEFSSIYYPKDYNEDFNNDFAI